MLAIPDGDSQLIRHASERGTADGARQTSGRCGNYELSMQQSSTEVSQTGLEAVSRCNSSSTDFTTAALVSGKWSAGFIRRYGGHAADDLTSIVQYQNCCS